MRLRAFAALCGLLAIFVGGPGRADPDASPEQRAASALENMTLEEKLGLVHGVLGAPWGGLPKPSGALGSAGYIPGIARLNIPALQETDAELGVANPGEIRHGDFATAMPSNLALGSTWSSDLAEQQGLAIGEEARAKGFNVLLAGAANLVRDPHGGRDFEYLSEDPLLTGRLAGAEIKGAQRAHVMSTLKHFALNDQETDRVELDARIKPEAARESDLLAFEIALETGRPGAVMCAYNKVNAFPSCENAWLLDEVLKGDWNYQGFVMSDWGAVHSTIASAQAGLDQESGAQLDSEYFFADPLRKAIADHQIPEPRLDDMVRRILTSEFKAETGAEAHPDRSSGDVALEIEREGAVLLKNNGVLPLRSAAPRIAVIGGHADIGVLAGGGSSQVLPIGGLAAKIQVGPNEAEFFDPSPPLTALRNHYVPSNVAWDDGRDIDQAARMAAQADVAIVFATEWRREGFDAQNLDLDDAQTALIEKVATANARTVVVLETGGPILTPWIDRVAAVLEAWYPGQRGGEAIADILSGRINPSGRLPLTFPQSEAQLPRVKPAGDPGGAPPGPLGLGAAYPRTCVLDYSEGALVGYKWFESKKQSAAFPFGYGLSYTTFSLAKFSADKQGERVVLRASVANDGNRQGIATPQFYVETPQGDLRLVGYARIELKPGQSEPVAVEVDPRLLAGFSETARHWLVAPGRYRFSCGFDVSRRERVTDIDLTAASLPP